MNASIWDVLGIAETTDERAIKRAYAARLKITSPESDAAGYMKLRDAYEAAKNHVAFLRIIADQQRVPQAEIAEILDSPPPPDAAATASPTASPQQQALAELRSLLPLSSESSLDQFLKRVEAIKAARIFATLDEQNDFIGEVALLAQQVDAVEVPWRGYLAALLGARERENIFAHGSVYWHAYEALLKSYSEVRDEATQAHLTDHDEIAATPGYLHVYHVLTAPFDSERLMALTRSQTYHRLAENILQRSRADPAIEIPAENREWWERTRMAGHHRPAADPAPVPAEPAPEGKSSGFPIWPIGFIIWLLFNVIRQCSGSS